MNAVGSQVFTPKISPAIKRVSPSPAQFDYAITLNAAFGGANTALVGAAA